MFYYPSKDLGSRLEIPLAKWKRWVREFLPPDPLGGLQSGFARQFNLKDAFRVYLGGCLVGILKFTIPESRVILDDLEDWLQEHGFYRLQANSLPVPRPGADLYTIHVYPGVFPRQEKTFGYTIGTLREAGAGQTDSAPGVSGIYSLETLNAGPDPILGGKVATARTLCVSTLHERFLARLNVLKPTRGQRVSS